jgi:hypothetical protein
MKLSTIAVFMGLLVLTACGGPVSEEGPSTAATSDSTGDAAPDDALHRSLEAMPNDDAHAQAMADIRPDHDRGIVTDVRLPDEIRSAWTGIRIRVVDSSTGESERFDIPLGEVTPLGSSGLTLVADSFIPDFAMDEAGITSRSADPANPAARVVISEQGAEPYEGWLFATMPDIHPYPHDRYRVLLEEGIPAG